MDIKDNFISNNITSINTNFFSESESEEEINDADEVEDEG